MRINSITTSGTTHNLKNVVVIVGANNSGKTVFLKELETAITGNHSPTSHWTLSANITVDGEDYDNWKKYAVRQDVGNKQGHFYCAFSDQSGDEQQRVLLPSPEDIRNTSLVSGQRLYKQFVRYFSVETRTGLPNEADQTPIHSHAIDILNLLYRHPQEFKKIKRLYEKFFQQGYLHIADHIEHKLQLVISNEKDLPAYSKKSSAPKRLRSYENYMEKKGLGTIRDANVASHGTRAFLNLSIYYPLPVNPLVLIDEPELHLYPSLKFLLGKVIGSLPAKFKKQVVIVTHDKDMISGVINSAKEITLIKLSKHSSGNYSIKTTNYDSTNKLKPNQANPSYLSAPFNQAVIFVEGITDLYSYDVVVSSRNYLEGIDYEFIAAGGSGDIAQAEKIASDLEIPYIAIFDLDQLRDPTNLKKMISLSGEAGIHTTIDEIAKLLVDHRISETALKKQGLKAISDNALKTKVTTLISELKVKNIFLVPVGSLESWITVNADKSDYYEKFRKKYLRSPSKYRDINDFFKEITDSIKSRL